MEKIFRTREAIILKIFRAYCDFCSRTAPRPSILVSAILSIRRTDNREREYAGPEEVYEIVPPITEAGYIDELGQAGWKIETVHGKLLVVCPDCVKL